jgi:transcriptional regulator with XRE-family HTH domain
MRTIRELRQERGWTQYELAVKVGVHPQAVYLWESGRRTPQVPQLRKLGQLFGMCSDEIELEHFSVADSRGKPSRPRLIARSEDGERED